MAIVRVGGGALAPRTGLEAAAKGAKHPAKKHAAKKHAAKKHAAKKHADKHPGKKAAKKAAKHVAQDDIRITLVHDAEDYPADLSLAFHHLQRAGAVISLLGQDSGGDLRMLLEQGIGLYRSASNAKAKAQNVRCAHGLLSAAEHLGMAGLYAARADHRVEVPPPPRSLVARNLKELAPRLEKLAKKPRRIAHRLESMALELLRRAEKADDDPHLVYELTMAADGICTALENGL